MSNKTYRLYPKAIEDLESIYLYSERKFGLKRTEDYIFAVEASFQYLANEPLIAKKCDYIRQDLRGFSVGSHIVFFKITDYGIAIIRILHQSMDFCSHFN